MSPLWAVLEQNLAEKHDATPTRSLSEIQCLHEAFPNNIYFLTVTVNDVVVAGVVLFRTATVLHSQYICSNDLGRTVCALDIIFHEAIELGLSLNCRYFSFGICNEDNGRILNDGLYRFKSEFGGAGVVHEFYEIDL